MIIYKAMIPAAVVLFLAVCLALPGASARGAAESSTAVAAADARVKEVFEQRCARCHGRDGRGSTTMGRMLEAPDFTDAEWWRGVTDERARASVVEGKGQMPAFRGKLTRPEVRSLVAYVRGFAAAGDKSDRR